MRGAYRFFTLILLLVFTLGCPNNRDSTPSDSDVKRLRIIQFTQQDLIAFQQKNPLLLAHQSIQNSDFNKLEKVVNNLPDINKKGAMGKSLIHTAAQQNSEKIMQYLIARGADPNMKDVFQRTPLHYSASLGNKEIVNLLIKAGADVTHQTKDHFSILHAAVAGNRPRLVKLCLKKGADVNLKYTGTYPPLYYAVAKSRHRLIEILRAAGADILSSETIAQAAAQQGNRALLKQILSKKGGKISLSAKNDLLHAAARGGHLAAVQFLLQVNADINSQNPRQTGEYLLHSAVRSGNTQLVEFLFKKGIPINNHSQMGKHDLLISPFHLALKSGKNRVALLLKAKGVKIEYDHTTMALAIQGGLINFVQECLAQGTSLSKVIATNSSLPHRVAAAGHQEMMVLLLKNGVSINSRDRNGKTPLHWATFYQKHKTIDFLLANGSNINAQDKKGETPLYSAITYRHISTIRFLLEKGADPSITNIQHHTPVFKAVRLGLKRIAMLLLAREHNLAITTISGDNLLHAAVMGQWPELIEFLVVTKNMKINGANSHGITPLHLAARGGREQLIRLLLKLGANRKATDHKGKTPAEYLQSKASQSVRALLSNT